MGMSASQARLLSLTSRLHDIEYKAQNLQSQKIALATQQDELYEDYCDALDATKIQVAYWNPAGTGNTYHNASYATVCAYNEQLCSQYALKDSSTGKLYVTEEIKNNYEQFDNDKYSFAWAMMGFENDFDWAAVNGGAASGGNTSECGQYVRDYWNENSDPRYNSNNSDFANYIHGGVLLMTGSEIKAYENLAQTDSVLVDKFEAIKEIDENDKEAIKKATEAFIDYLYSKPDCFNEVFNMMNINKQGDDSEDLNYPDLAAADIQNEFNHYVRLWEAINQAGGCTTIDPGCEGGEAGEQWFQKMVESGRAIILEYAPSGTNKGWNETSVATSTNKGYLQSVQDDTDLKKAEAEYEHQLKIINRKETKIDTELDKLETERSAITQEMESIDKVKGENIERTFNIFN